MKHKSCREINLQSAIMDLRRRSGHSRWLLWSLMFCLIFNNVSDALKCYFCYGSDESLDCHLPEDEHGNQLASSTPTMKIISCLSSDDYCYKIHYSFNGKPVTGRGCGGSGFCDNQRAKIVAEANAINDCALCSRNLCNSSRQLRDTIQSSVLLIGGLVLLLFLRDSFR